MTRLTKMSASDLVEDYSLYPRHAVDGSHIAELARAMEAGAFDAKRFPVVVDRATLRVVDGFHRERAWKRVYGDGAQIEVELRDYTDEAALVRDAVSLNSNHGRRLDKQDRTRSLLMLQRLGVADVDIAVCLHTTAAEVLHLSTRVTIVKDNPGSPGTVIPAKAVVAPKKGEEPRVITSDQADVMHGSSGLRTGQVVTQLARELRSHLVDVEAPGLREKLEDLAAAIAEVL